MELKKDYFIKTYSKKKTALKNSEYIRLLGDRLIDRYGEHYKRRLEKRSERIKGCLNYWEWDKYELNKVLDLRKLYRCRDMYCPNCRSWNSAKSIVKFRPYFNDLLLKGYSPYFMTLTVPNIKGDVLGGEIDKLNKAFATIWRWLNREDKKGFKGRMFRALGAIRVIELTINKINGSFNVHIHVLIFLDKYYINEFMKTHEGGYRFKSQSYIYYSDADIFIQKLWTMAYKGLHLTKFKDMSDNWKENFICDIRELEMPGGIYETFKYCFKDVGISNIKIFEDIFLGLLDRRMRQSYGLLFKLDKEIENGDDEIDDEILLSDYITIDEKPKILKVRAINEMIETYKDYIKLSRYKSDGEYKNIKD